MFKNLASYWNGGIGSHGPLQVINESTTKYPKQATRSKGTYMHQELWFCSQVKNLCAKVLNLRAQSTAAATDGHLIMDPGSVYYNDVGEGLAPSEVIIKCRSRIMDQVAMAMAKRKCLLIF